MIVNEALLDSAIKTLTVGIHLGRFRIGFPVHDIVCQQVFGKTSFELATVVGEGFGAGIVRKCLDDSLMQCSCVYAA